MYITELRQEGLKINGRSMAVTLPGHFSEHYHLTPLLTFFLVNSTPSGPSYIKCTTMHLHQTISLISPLYIRGLLTIITRVGVMFQVVLFKWLFLRNMNSLKKFFSCILNKYCLFRTVK